MKESKDRFGGTFFEVSSNELQRFDELLKELRKHPKVREAGLVKLRLPVEDRDPECFEKVLSLMRRKFSESKYNRELKAHVPCYEPDCQTVLKCSADSDIYEYVRSPCTQEERNLFVSTVTDPKTYSATDNCCSQVLDKKGQEGLRDHLFQELRDHSPFSADLCQERLKQGIEEPSKEFSPLLYGAGIQFDRRAAMTICPGFSLFRVTPILDEFKERYDGIYYPMVYSGFTNHTLFAWHVEDYGLLSINYLIAGASKQWYSIPPKYFGAADHLVSTFPLNVAHTSCRAVLVGHKSVVCKPTVFEEHNIPTDMTSQEPGEIIITFPFCLHSGFNLGNNLAVAANFGDTDWIELGMHAPKCVCNDELEIKLDFHQVLSKYKPELLDSYIRGSLLGVPPNHPRQIVFLPELTQPVHAEDFRSGVPKQGSSSGTISGEVSMKHTTTSRSSMKERILICPRCKAIYTGNKMDRLKAHISREHPIEAKNLLRVVKAAYPAWKPKTASGNTCDICKKFIRGSATHLSIHRFKMH